MHLLVHHHSKKRKLPASNFWARFLDRVTLAVGVIGPLTTIPQITKIIESRHAIGVSELSWGGAAFFDIPFLLYGIAHKDRAITTTYSLWLIGNSLIVALAIFYS
jgi:uncharacterized protein with PQ loop repeat